MIHCSTDYNYSCIFVHQHAGSDSHLYVHSTCHLSGRAKSVKRFERSNGLDTALYKNYLYLFFTIITSEIIVLINSSVLYYTTLEHFCVFYPIQNKSLFFIDSVLYKCLFLFSFFLNKQNYYYYYLFLVRLATASKRIRLVVSNGNIDPTILMHIR